MTNLMDDLRSPQWWFGVVLAGIIVNIVAAYLFRLVDGRLTEVSAWWRARQAAAVADRDAAVEALRGNPHEEALVAAAEIRSRLRALVCVVQSVGMAVLVVLFIFMGVPSWVSIPAIAIFAVLWCGFIHQHRQAEKASSVLAELHRSRR